MARIFNEGFEFNNKGQFYRASEVSFGTGSTPYPPRMPGGYTARFDKGGSLTARIEPVAEIYTRFLYFPNTWESGHYCGRRLIFANAGGTVVAQVYWGYQDQPNAPYGVGLHLGTPLTLAASSPELLRDYEHRAVIEVHFRYTLSESTASSPNFEMRVNGSSRLEYTGPTAFQPSSPPEEPVEYKIRDITYTTPKWGGLDDVAINDTSGSVDNGWCGDGVIALLKPKGNSIVQLSPSTAKDNFVLVGDLSGGTWVESDVAGRHDVYTVAAPTLHPNDTIKRVWAQATARKLNIDSPGIAVGLDSGSGMQWSEGLEIGLNLTGVRGKQHLDNGGAPWTQAALSQLKVGVKVE